MAELYRGSCHCGAVRFAYEGEPITKGMRCNCSICIRKGALMSTDLIPAERLHIEADEDNLAMYQFGREIAKHYFCNRCGIYTFHETVRSPGHFRVNLGCIEGIDPLVLEAEIFDGKHAL